MDPEITRQETKEIPKQKSNSNIYYFAQMALRTLVIAFSLAGTIIMVTGRQTFSAFTIVTTYTYSFSSAFKFNVIANSIVCGLVLLSVILVVALNRPKSNPKDYFYLLLLDLVSLILLLSGSSAAMAIGLLGRSGQPQTGSPPMCDNVPKFCDKMTDSIESSVVAVICSFVLTIMAAHKLKP